MLGVVLLFHPMPGGDRIYEGVQDDVTRWLVVHLVLAVFVGLMAAAVWLLLDGLTGRAATVSRIALFPFVVGFLVWEGNIGIGTAVLVDYANGLPPAERAPVADTIQDYFTNPIMGDPSFFSVLGNGAWVLAMTAAAVAYGRVGASWPLTVLLGASSLFVLHAMYVGTAGLICFAAAAILAERFRARPAPTSPTAPDAQPVPAADGADVEKARAGQLLGR